MIQRKNNFELAKRIKRLRENRHLTQEELGGILNVTRATIWQYENGVRVPPVNKIIELSEVLLVDVNYLLGIEQLCISSDDEDYGFNITKKEIELIKTIRKNKNLYTRLINSPYIMDKIKI